MRLKIPLAVIASLILMLGNGCDQALTPTSGQPSFQFHLPYSDNPFDLLVEDMDGNGLADITAVDHGKNTGQTFYQEAERRFVPGPLFKETGFHPGNLLRWPDEGASLVHSAEGENQIRALRPREDRSGYDIISGLKVPAPRYATLFHWPDWGPSLAIAPFLDGKLFLIKGYDPDAPDTAQLIEVPLSKHGNSLRQAGPISTADLDGDGVDELLFASSMTREIFMIHAPGKGQKEPVHSVRLAGDRQWGRPNEVVPFDINGDGAVDLLLPNQIDPSGIMVLLNDGKGHVREVSPIPSAFSRGLRQLVIGKDKDGRDYGLATGYGGVSLYRFSDIHAGGDVVPPESLTVNTDERDTSDDLVLKDIDGDGYLDGVVGRTSTRDGNIWVVYGPLWEHFEQMVRDQFVIGSTKH